MTDSDDGVAIHAKLVPATFDSRLTLADVAPLHIVCDIDALVTKGNGLMVAIWLAEVPTHPLKVGVTA